jgi:glycosyltransferase involved in cell wall biosynthesis
LAKIIKILHVIHDLSKDAGGAPYAVKNILDLEMRLNLDPEVLTTSNLKLSNFVETSAKIHHFKRTFPSRFSRSTYANSWLYKNARNYDLISIHSIWSLLQIDAAKIAADLDVPYIIRPHGSLDPFDLKKKKYLKKLVGPFLIRPMLDNSHSINCTAQLECDKLEKYGARVKAIALSLPVNLTEKTGNGANFRKVFGYNNDDFVFLFLSRIDYKKGLNLLIPAVARLSKKFPNIKLAIAGSGSDGYEAKVRQWIKEEAAENNINICGFLAGEDKFDAFAGSDCFVLPSMNENFGIAVVEALSLGLPVLLSDNVYIWKEIIDKEGGWVCSYSKDSVQDKLEEIVNNPDELKRKKGSARNAAKQFSPESLKSQYLEYYQSILGMRK